jgi:hypothetical protein
MSTLRDRAQQAVDAGYRPTDLAKAAGVTSGAVSQWLSGQTKTLKAHAALGLARLTGWPAEWWVSGRGPRAVAQPPHGGAPTSVGADLGGSIAQNFPEPQAILLPSTIDWETIAMGTTLPERFVVAMPDDALAPQTPRGTELIMVAGDKPPRFGVGVLVEDAAGERYIRRLVQGPAGGWIAQARDSAYRSVSSAEGGRVLAWVQGRMDGAV